MQIFTDMTFFKELWACIVISFAAASISYTITQTELFVPIRNLANKMGHMIGYLFHCFYCMGHWVIIIAVLIYKPIIINSGHMVVDLIVTGFFIVTLMTFVNGFMFKSFSSAIKKMTDEMELKEKMSKKNNN